MCSFLVWFPHVYTLLRIIYYIQDRLLANFPTVRSLRFTWVQFALWIYTEVFRWSWTDPVFFLCSHVAIKNGKCVRSADSELTGWWRCERVWALSPSKIDVFQTLILSDHCESSGSVVTSAVETVALLQKLKHICHWCYRLAKHLVSRLVHRA